MLSESSSSCMRPLTRSLARYHELAWVSEFHGDFLSHKPPKHRVCQQSRAACRIRPVSAGCSLTLGTQYDRIYLVPDLDDGSSNPSLSEVQPLRACRPHPGTAARLPDLYQCAGLLHRSRDQGAAAGGRVARNRLH